MVHAVEVSTYDQIGRSYGTTRRADPRIAARVSGALADIETSVSVGAGTGSYEPSSTVLGVEPSAVMVAQRPAGAAACVRGVAEALPLADDSVDASLAILTLHHWTDVTRGIAEMRRVARRRVVILTWDQGVFESFWLVRDYLPAAGDVSRAHAVPLDDLVDLLPGARVQTIPVPHDCLDGFGAAFWRRPAAYLDPSVRRGISMLALAEPAALAAGLRALESDIDSGRWERENRDLSEATEYDAGYRLVTAELPGRVGADR